jgi:23S rRNA (cytidine2498-2'-O)-methyltransferase
MTTSPSAAPRIIFSAAEDFMTAAREELAEAFGTGATFEQLGHDTGSIAARGQDIAQVAEACRRHPLVFIRHLMREVRRLPPMHGPDAPQVIAEAVLALAREHEAPTTFALHVWLSVGTPPPGFRPDELWRAIAETLTGAGYTVTRGNQDMIVSVCVTPAGVILGYNARADALADWPGGRVGLARSAAQISRAEFKLEELFTLYPLTLPSQGIVLDLGASPGGWARIMRTRGLAVWAVDPARLDPRLASDRGLHYAQMTAAAFLAQTRTYFDLILNDMRMDANLSCQQMIAAAPRLRPDGYAIITLKLPVQRPRAEVARAFGILERAYTVVFARQLFHNRHEVTVVVRHQRRARGR